MWYLIVSILDLSTLTYFVWTKHKNSLQALNYDLYETEGELMGWRNEFSFIVCALHVSLNSSSLTGVTALWSLSKTHLSSLSTGSTKEDLSLFNLKSVDET